jgi:hypothetical protein
VLRKLGKYSTTELYPKLYVTFKTNSAYLILECPVDKTQMAENMLLPSLASSRVQVLIHYLRDSEVGQNQKILSPDTRELDNSEDH